MNSRPARSLSTILALRLAGVSAVAILGLLSFFFVKYTSDIEYLRRATLQAEVQAVRAAFDHGRDPARLAQYRRRPASYAFRVFDRRGANRKVLAEANAGLFVGTDLTQGDTGAEADDLEERFSQVALPGPPERHFWTLVTRVVDHPRRIWVQVAMINDPDWRWTGVIATELEDHVAVPGLAILPALTLAMFIAVRHALRPLRVIAAQATALGERGAIGRPLAPLRSLGLPQEFRQVVAALNQMLVRLEQSLTRQRQFTAHVAHELRTPLSVLQLEVSQLPPSATRRRIADELHGLGRTITQLLHLAQADEAQPAADEPIDLAQLAQRVCEDLAPSAMQRGLDIEFEHPPGRVRLRGQPALLEVAIRNLVENALRYSPPAGTVSVCVTEDARVIVGDRGPGVPDSQKQLVFERFWRADPSRPDGAGIGLALARRVADLHGGSLILADRPGGGAHFTLDLAALPNDRETCRL